MNPTSLSHTERGFGALLRELREQRGLPLRALGHPSTIHHYETGRQQPRTRSTVVKMAAVLNIDPGLLFDVLGWPHRPISQEVQVVRALIDTDAAQAAQAAQAGLERALELGLMNEVYQWQLALADARRAVGPHPLPVDFRGRGDVDKWRVQATDLIQHDEWSSAVLLLDSLLAYMPSSHPSYGKTVYNLAVAQAALGEYVQAEGRAREVWEWAIAEQDGWLAVLACEAIARFSVADGRPVPPEALKVLSQYQGNPDSQRYVACWVDDVLTHEAAHRGDWATADHHARSLRYRVEQHADLHSEALRVALATAVTLAVKREYDVALAVMDPALLAAIDAQTPGYLLVDALMLAAEWAVVVKDPTAVPRITWLEGWLGGLRAFSQLQRLETRLNVRLNPETSSAERVSYYRAFWGSGPL